MRKAFYILSAALCFGCMYSNNLKAEADVQNIGFGNILSSKSSTDGAIGLGKEDFTIDKKTFDSNSNKLAFDLKIAIPDGYVLESNERQGAGKSLEINLKDRTNEVLDITYPVSKAYIVNAGKPVTNHIYDNKDDKVVIPINIINPKDVNILDVDYQLCDKEKNVCLTPDHQEIQVTK